MNMIKEIKGDLLEFPEGIDTIMHCCNCQCVMGGGIAFSIANAFPDAYKVDLTTNNQGVSKAGGFTYHKEPDGKRIVNLYGQHGIGRGRQINYENLYTAIDLAMDTLALHEGIVGIPKFMGCGLAGGDWRIVKAMIEVLSEKHKCRVVIVEYDG
jgi:O-acetyl-ADP-ribose deacetylase (regulator of RNase III)